MLKFGEMIHQKKAASRYVGIAVSFREGITFFVTQICPKILQGSIDTLVSFFHRRFGSGKWRENSEIMHNDESDARSPYNLRSGNVGQKHMEYKHQPEAR